MKEFTKIIDMNIHKIINEKNKEEFIFDLCNETIIEYFKICKFNSINDLIQKKNYFKIIDNLLDGDSKLFFENLDKISIDGSTDKLSHTNINEQKSMYKNTHIEFYFRLYFALYPLIMKKMNLKVAEINLYKDSLESNIKANLALSKSNDNIDNDDLSKRINNFKSFIQSIDLNNDMKKNLSTHPEIYSFYALPYIPDPINNTIFKDIFTEEWINKEIIGNINKIFNLNYIRNLAELKNISKNKDSILVNSIRGIIDETIKKNNKSKIKVLVKDDLENDKETIEGLNKIIENHESNANIKTKLIQELKENEEKLTNTLINCQLKWSKFCWEVIKLFNEYNKTIESIQNESKINISKVNKANLDNIKSRLEKYETFVKNNVKELKGKKNHDKDLSKKTENNNMSSKNNQNTNDKNTINKNSNKQSIFIKQQDNLNNNFYNNDNTMKGSLANNVYNDHNKNINNLDNKFDMKSDKVKDLSNLDKNKFVRINNDNQANREVYNITDTKFNNLKDKIKINTGEYNIDETPTPKLIYNNPNQELYDRTEKEKDKSEKAYANDKYEFSFNIKKTVFNYNNLNNLKSSKVLEQIDPIVVNQLSESKNSNEKSVTNLNSQYFEAVKENENTKNDLLKNQNHNENNNLNQNLIKNQESTNKESLLLNFFEVKSYFSKICESNKRDQIKTANILAEIRYNIEKAEGIEIKLFYFYSMIYYDIFGFSTIEKKSFIEYILNSESCIEFLNLCNIISNFKIGRYYLINIEGFVQKIAITLMNEKSESEIRQITLGVIQKLTLIRNVQIKLSHMNVIKWIVEVLLTDEDLTEYSLEYGMALLMNLSLCEEGRKKCIEIEVS